MIDIKRAQLYNGNCIEIMPTLEADSVDSIVTDPPYGLKFMGNNWDHGVPGEPFWREALRVAKPGAHLLAFGGTRTFHRLAVAIEDAGWEIRDTIMWVHSQGFPKNHDISKQIEKMADTKREVVGTYKTPDNGRDYTKEKSCKNGYAKTKLSMGKDVGIERRLITAPATDDAKKWEGFGTALKPAWEPVIVARKPVEQSTTKNVLKWGTGAMNIDGCRVGMRSKNESGWSKTGSKASENRAMSGGNYDRDAKEEAGQGRFPANFIHDGSDEVVRLFPVTTSGSGVKSKAGHSIGMLQGEEAWRFTHDGNSYNGDTGSAARFFYCAKASKQDRDEGLEDMPRRETSLKYNGGDEFAGRTKVDGEWVNTNKSNRIKPRNHHPTVKPTQLMRYLVRLVTPSGGTVLDPFMGSGSTGKAAILEGDNFIGIEMSEEYIEIARARIEKAHELYKEENMQGELFGGNV